MEQFIKAASVSDVPPGSMKTVTLPGGLLVAIANVDGEFFALSDRCTHDECSLGSEGFLDGVVVTCGCHGAQFDVTTGDVLALPATQPEKTYEVRVEGNEILIAV